MKNSKLVKESTKWTRNQKKERKKRCLFAKKRGSDQKLKDLKLGVKTVKKYRDDKEIVGGSKTHIAFKNNTNNFAVGTFGSGLRLVKNDYQIYCQRLPEKCNVIQDIVYIPCLNCYLLACLDKIYRKDIDDKPPYLWMVLACGVGQGASFVYSAPLERLIISKKGRSIVIINPRTKKLGVNLESKADHRFIQKFRIFGQEENQVVSVTRDCQVFLYNLYKSPKRGVVGQYQIQKLNERQEKPASLAICDKNEYILVEVEDYSITRRSRIFIFKVKKDVLIKIASIDESIHLVGHKSALKCFSSLGNHILWVGLSGKGFTQIYHYNSETEVLEELKDKRVRRFINEPLKLHIVEGEFYYLGSNGKLMRLSVSF